MAVAEAITETVEVGKQDSSLLVGEFDDRVLVERDASSDAVVIRRQKVFAENHSTFIPEAATRLFARLGFGITTKSFFSIW